MITRAHKGLAMVHAQRQRLARTLVLNALTTHSDQGIYRHGFTTQVGRFVRVRGECAHTTSEMCATLARALISNNHNFVVFWFRMTQYLYSVQKKGARLLQLCFFFIPNTVYRFLLQNRKRKKKFLKKFMTSDNKTSIISLKWQFKL